MNIAHIEPQSFIYGPGCRFVIWVQGCSIHCKGCWNSSMWSFDKKNEYSVPELVKMIVAESVEGVTILGGEPLDQLTEVHALCSECHQLGLTTMVFTGYDLSEIDNSDKSSIKSVSDILIVGRYDENLRTLDSQWIGSTNQQILFLTARYADYEMQNANYMEIDIDKNGSYTVLGFPTNWIMEPLSSEY